MENASKALIIAAAILISIMIISLGIWVFSMANKATSGVNLDEATVAQFNQKFSQYEGNRVSGSKVKSLLDAVRTNNTSNIDDSSMQVEVELKYMVNKATNTYTVSDQTVASEVTKAINGDTTKTGAKGYIKNGSTYKVSFTYAESGLIEKITIAENS